jgi:hypothetical protein
MTLKDQFCTPQQARILKEKGIRQDNTFFFIGDQGPFLGSAAIPDGTCQNGQRILQQRVSAFSVAELGVMLPEWIERGGERYRRLQWSNTLPHKWKETPYEFRIEYRDTLDNAASNISLVGGVEAACRATMLIYLLENQYITAAEVNERLKY